MKTILRNLFLAVFGIVMFIACTKSNDSKSGKHEKDQYRVLSIGQDTSTSKVVFARVQTVGLLVVEDSKLKAELISYKPLPNGLGEYVVTLTNKQECQMISRWTWDHIGVQSIEANDSTSGTHQNGVLRPYQVKTYTIIAKSLPGRIYVKAEKSNSECPNSSTLILEITMQILPITYTSVKASYNELNGVVTISYAIDDPTVIEYFVIQKFVDGEWKDIYTFTCDKKTKSYNIPIFADEEK